MRDLLVIETPKQVGKKVSLSGMAKTVRDHGKVLFIDLADETGIVQTVSRSKFDVSELDIVKIEGNVKKRPENLINKNIETGEIEIEIEKLEVISKSKTPPFPTDGEGYDIEENLRLKYRYLDLRRQRMQKNLRLRHQVARLARNFLNDEDFVEIETPYLSKTTPEGSRDFLVPSRLHPGKFYALAQSPQQYKQMLMIAGFEKYYQFARAFRDEDMRADRQYEHTQIDIEMAYVNREDVMDLIERMYKSIAKALGKKILQDPFPVITYTQAMEKYNHDKFDMRKDKNDDTLAFAWVVDFPLLEYDEKEKRYTFSHNPFCAPKEEGIKDLMESKNLEKISSYQYDLVLNGEEVGGGSIRITDPKVQRQVFKVMGYSEKRIADEFGHLLEAYEYAAPPHGGIAMGLDRFCAMLSGEKSIREVIAFPVSGAGITSVMEAPSVVDPKTLKELKIKVQ
jgi:aspartyl-tRNA synthetase